MRTMQQLKMAAPAVFVSFGVFVLFLSDDVSQRNDVRQVAAKQHLDTLIAQERTLHAHDARLEGVIYDARGTILKRLSSDGSLSEAQDLAKRWLVQWYEQRKVETLKRSAEIDLQLGKLSARGASEEAIQREFDRLMLAPLRDIETALVRARAVTPEQALTTMIAYYDNLFELQRKRAEELNSPAPPKPIDKR